MTEAERKALGEERRCIFQNIANGVPMPEIMATFKRSEQEVLREVAFVAKKIGEYRFRRRMPPLLSRDLPEIRWNRKALLETLSHLGPVYLSSGLLIPQVKVQKLDHPSMAREAFHRINNA